MNRKLEEIYEKTRNVKNNDKYEKIFLRRQGCSSISNNFIQHDIRLEFNLIKKMVMKKNSNDTNKHSDQQNKKTF